MSDWKRVTREISFEQAPAEMKAELHRHIELYNLGDILSDAVICIQSDSEKAKKGLFGSAETNQVVAILTPRWLLWVVSGSKTPATATSAFLNDVVIQITPVHLLQRWFRTPEFKSMENLPMWLKVRVLSSASKTMRPVRSSSNWLSLPFKMQRNENWLPFDREPVFSLEPGP